MDFQEISIGFSAEQVLNLAGHPESITPCEEGECWHYQNDRVAVYLGGEKWPWVRKLIIKRHRVKGKRPGRLKPKESK